MLLFARSLPCRQDSPLDWLRVEQVLLGRWLELLLCLSLSLIGLVPGWASRRTSGTHLRLCLSMKALRSCRQKSAAPSNSLPVYAVSWDLGSTAGALTGAANEAHGDCEGEYKSTGLISMGRKVNITWRHVCQTLNLFHKGCAGPWALFWALKKALKRVNPLKKTLLRANPLFWVLKKVFKKVSLIKRALKKVLLWVINSKKCSKKSGLLKKVKFESSAQKRAHLSWTPQKNAQKSGLH